MYSLIRMAFLFFIVLSEIFPFQTDLLTTGLKYGEYSTGFKLLTLSDYSRSYNTSNSRDLRAYLWYPAEKNENSPLTIGDFAKYAYEDFNPVSADFNVNSRSEMNELPLARGLSDTSWAEFVSKELISTLNPLKQERKFPLIIFGQGLYYESPLTHIVLCEYLASHGYVVITCPLLGSNSRLVRLNNVDLEAQVRDLEYLLSYSLQLDNVDREKVGAIGFDMGGMSALTMCMRNNSIKAFVTTDAGIVFPHSSGLPGSSPNYNPASFSIPWMHMTRASSYYAELSTNKETSLYEQKISGDSYLVLFDTAPHVNFTSYSLFGIQENVPGYWSSAESIFPSTYMTVCNKTLAFFDYYLKGMDSSLSLLNFKDPDSEILYEVISKKGVDRGPEFEAFSERITVNGIESAIDFFMNVQNTYLDNKLADEERINELAYKYLYFWSNTKIAISLFELNVNTFPDSPNVYDSLGEAYYITGNRELTIKNYKRALELNPENKNAKLVLDELTGGEKNNE
ncbi:MAG: hypothetical protein KKA84_04545 [Bacteroidetes bacterium]|nr:hypothetical protein [Bacteroidota bacterium]